MRVKYILVTGASGFLGSNLCARLLNDGYSVIGIGRKEKGCLSDEVLNNPFFKYLRLDLNNSRNLIKNLESYKIDTCFHLASIVEYAGHEYHEYHEYHENVIIPAINITKLVKALGINRIIFSSTLSVITSLIDNDIVNENTSISPSSNYGLSKFNCEKLLEFFITQNKDIDCIVLRFPLLYGIDHLGGIVHDFRKTLEKDEELVLYGRGNYLRNIMHIDDAVNVLILSINANLKGYKLFCIGSNNSLSIKEIALILKKLLNSNSEIILSDKISANNFNAILDIDRKSVV